MAGRINVGMYTVVEGWLASQPGVYTQVHSPQVFIWITSHKKFSEGKQVHVGMETSKTNQTRWE